MENGGRSVVIRGDIGINCYLHDWGSLVWKEHIGLMHWTVTLPYSIVESSHKAGFDLI